MVKNLIKLMLRITDTGASMVDCVKYPIKNSDGYSGNSLLEKNVLFCVKSYRDFNSAIVQASKIENFNYQILKINNINDLERVSQKKTELGYFDKIVNILNFDDKDYELIDKLNFNNEDVMHMTYHLLQLETTYMIDNCGDGIATALIVNQHSDGVIDETIGNLLKGLGLPLAAHHIICNSLVANANIPSEDIINTLMFLISKYGYELNGECLNLGC